MDCSERIIVESSGQRFPHNSLAITVLYFHRQSAPVSRPGSGRAAPCLLVFSSPVFFSVGPHLYASINFLLPRVRVFSPSLHVTSRLAGESRVDALENVGVIYAFPANLFVFADLGLLIVYSGLIVFGDLTVYLTAKSVNDVLYITLVPKIADEIGLP